MPPRYETSVGVVEPVDVRGAAGVAQQQHGGLCLSPRWPFLPPDHLRLQGFEERFDRGVVVTVALATH